MIDLHFVAPGLAVGAHFPMDAAARLSREHGISRVVDVRMEACDDEEVLRVHRIRLLHLPTHDTRAISLESIDHGVAFASEGLERGESVLVHCQWGIGRSALLAVCTLVARGQAPLAALEQAKRARPIVSPSPEQLEALVAFSARVKAARGASWPVPTLDELGAIAWRHLRHEPDREAARAASTRASS
ncbi:protein-tyrosine phosphatase family protein [Anaeromyxobacter oryzae]|uniref:protein-tyrosine phosphatase family protein n=1 Tax=Anaeromyxobacter oryzae TaxID=2918170 RepID=UPI0020C03CDA|nr:dual specificity protein phosphatase [Anaeromyxobacter oryzae]